jgi:hypothetical protein
LRKAERAIANRHGLKLEWGYAPTRIAKMVFRSAALVALALGALPVAAAAPQVPPQVGGTWSALGAWPLISIHAALTPGGNVLTYGTDAAGKQTGRFIYDVWDPSQGSVTGGHTTLPNSTGTDIFCSAQVLLPQGDVFIAGGDNFVHGETTTTGNSDANLFTSASNALSRAGSMHRARWYGSVTTLPSGETYIQGGTGGADRPEVRAADGTFRLLAIDTSALDQIYPRNFVAPDGRLFGIDLDGRMYFIAADLSALTLAGNIDVTGSGSSAVMYAPGKILQIGGNSDGAITIDINSGTPQVAATAKLASRRDLVTATVLADGRVLATGGSAEWNQAVGINNSAALWDPAMGQWLIGPDGAVARLYHSLALLLPDASVLVAGGGAPGPYANSNAEIYYPPYLFDAAGALATRPQITAAPASITPGSEFDVQVAAADNIARVSLIKSGSVTHSWNMDQRFTELAFVQSGTTLTLTPPANANLMPPGYYLLFALNSAGVPSIAKIVKANIVPATSDTTGGGSTSSPTPTPVPAPAPAPAPEPVVNPPASDPVAPSIDAGASPAPNQPSAAASGGGGGCAMSKRATADPLLALLLCAATGYFGRRARGTVRTSPARGCCAVAFLLSFGNPEAEMRTVATLRVAA